MKQLLILALFGITFSFFGCRKDQRTVRKMDGKWNVIQAISANSQTIDPDLIFEFEECRVRKEDFCEFTLHDFSLDEVYPGTYTVNRTGEVLVLSWQHNFVNHYEQLYIERLNFRTIILRNLHPNSSFYKELKLRAVD